MTTPAITRTRNLLLANTTLTAIVGTDIYWPLFPGDIILPGIVLQPNGGSTNPGAPLREVSVMTKCYYNTSITARSLHETMRDALLGADFSDRTAHAVTLRTYGIIWIREEQEAQDLIDPAGADKGIPYALGFYTIRVAD